MHVGNDGEPTDVPEWTHISHNLILNGPTIGHTSSLFPFVDNDDGKDLGTERTTITLGFASHDRLSVSAEPLWCQGRRTFR